MMNTSRWLQATVLATASFLTIGALSPTTAATFDTTEVNSSNFIAVAAPYGSNQHQLLIIEQVSNKRPCWSESGSNPVNVEPLLLNFDFTGICGRSTDSNGYSIRMNGEDLGLDYLLRVVERDGDLVLVGSNRRNLAAPTIEIGRTQGISNGFQKIVLNQGWRLTRRTYQGKALGHIYITSDSSVNQVSNTSTPPLPPNSQPLPPLTRPLPPNSQPLPPSSQPLPPLTQPLPSSPQTLPPAERELIFTKPDAGLTIPRSTTPATSSPTVTPPSTSERQLPVFVVPTKPQAPQPVPQQAPKGQTPATSPQRLPSLPPSSSTVPAFVLPKN